MYFVNAKTKRQHPGGSAFWRIGSSFAPKPLGRGATGRHLERYAASVFRGWRVTAGFRNAAIIRQTPTAWHGTRPARRSSHVPALSTPGLVFEASVSISLPARYAGMATALTHAAWAQASNRTKMFHGL